MRRGWHVGNGEIVRYAEDDVEPVLDANKAEFNATPETRKFGGKTFHRVARIPPIIIEKWKNELGIDFFNRNHLPRVMALLDSPDYRYLKTMNITIGKGRGKHN